MIPTFSRRSRVHNYSLRNRGIRPSETENSSEINIEILENIVVPEIKMAPSINDVSRHVVDLIPMFAGEEDALKPFIDACDYFIRLYAIRDANELNEYLLKVILSKLTGKAYVLVGSRGPETWTDLKKMLLEYFSNKKDITTLAQEMWMIQPQRGEGVEEFSYKIYQSRKSIINKLTLEIDNVVEREIQIKVYEELAMQTFIRGLTNQISLVVRVKCPKTLEEAISYALAEELYHKEKQLANSFVKREPEVNRQSNRNAYRGSNFRNYENSNNTNRQNFNNYNNYNNGNRVNSNRFRNQPNQFNNRFNQNGNYDNSDSYYSQNEFRPQNGQQVKREPSDRTMKTVSSIRPPIIHHVQVHNQEVADDEIIVDNSNFRPGDRRGTHT
jgi:hypothetical protein